ncbi:MAG: hypothetical protein AB7L17_01080 [Ilumatobacteraceae bacterium]
MCRKLMWGVLVIGVLMIAAPFAIGLPGKSADGEHMIDAFAPIMEEQNVQQTADYYNDVFVPLGGVVPAMSQENVDKFNAYLAGFASLGAESQQLVPKLAQATGMSEQEVQQYLETEFPAMSQTLQGLPQMQQDFGGLLGLMGENVEIFQAVPAGLEHYEPLVTTMQEQRTNYESVASLPDFRVFTWMFAVPGALLVALALGGLFVTRGRGAEPTPLDDALPGRDRLVGSR